MLKKISTCLGLLLLGLLPAAARADNPAPHLGDRTETLFDPADEQVVVGVLDRLNPVAGSYYERDMQLPGTPIVRVSLGPTEADYRLLTALARLPRLRDFSATQSTPAQVKRIAQLRQVETLWLGAAELGTAEMKALGAMPGLRSLCFTQCNFVGDDPLKELAGASRLRSLNVAQCNVITEEGPKVFADEGVKGLSYLTSLQNLTLSDTIVTDAALAELIGLPDLRYLDLTGTAITNAGMQKLAHLSSLTELQVGFARVGDKGVKELCRLKGLQKLHLHNTDVTDAALAELAGLPNLRYLSLRETAITNAGLEKLSQSKSLTEVDLRGTMVGDEGVKELAGLKSLLHLNFHLTKVTDASLAELGGWPKLRSLSLCDTAITSAGLKQLARSKSLTQLDLSGTKVGDEGLAALARLPTLRFLYLHRCDGLTADGVRRLKAALPDCNIIGAGGKE